MTRHRCARRGCFDYAVSVFYPDPDGPARENPPAYLCPRHDIEAPRGYVKRSLT